MMVAINTTDMDVTVQLPVGADSRQFKELYFGVDAEATDGVLEFVLPQRSAGGTLVFVEEGGSGGGSTAPPATPERSNSDIWTLPLMAIGVLLVVVIYALVKHRPKK